MGRASATTTTTEVTTRKLFYVLTPASLMEGRKTTEEIDLEGQTNYLMHTRRSFLSFGTLMLDSLHIPSCVHPQKVYQ